MPTLWIALAGLAGSVAGGLGAALLRDPEATDPGLQERLTALAGELAALRDELEAERSATRELADAVADLRAGAVALPSAATDAPPSAASETPAPAREAAAAERSDAWFDAASLRELGTPDAEIERLQDLYEQNQLEILYLRDRATREGWRKQPRFRQERNEIEAALREDLDDAAFDRLLYATGRPNRVVLDSVFADSPAARAGFEAGDVVRRYGDRAIFGPRELQRATTQGRAGSTVAVDVQREGVPLRIYVPRGPLGARLRTARLPPEAR